MQTQQAPFFRPVHTSNYFSLSHQPASRAAPQSHRQQTQTNFFKPTSGQSAKQREAELVEAQLSQKGGDRLSALHCRLQQEAEKIRKWKNATEVEIKQKDKTLQDAQQTIDSQRKSLTDLQIRNEVLGSQLKDEADNRQEIQRKILATRDLCNALKDHVLRVEEAVGRGEMDRHLIYQLNQERYVQFQELTQKFQALELKSSRKQTALQETIHEECNKNDELRTELSSACSQIESLHEHSSQQQSKISALSISLQEKAHLCSQLGEKQVSLEQHLRGSEERLKEAGQIVRELEGQVASHCQQLEVTQRELEEASNRAREREESFLVRCQEYEAALSQEREKCAALERKKGELLATLQHTTSEAESVKGMLTTELESVRTRLQQTESSLGQSCADLERLLETERGRAKELEVCRERLEGRVGELVKEVTSVREEVEREARERAALGEQAKATLAETIHCFEAQLSHTKSEVASLEEKCRVLEGKREEEEGRVRGLSGEVGRLEETLEAERAAHETRINEMVHQVDTLRSSLHEVQEGNSALQGRLQDSSLLSRELSEAKEKEASLLQQCRDLEGEIVTMRAGVGEAEEGRRGVEAALDDARREINDKTEALRSQTEQAEQLSKVLEETRGELVRSTEERRAEVQQYKAEATSARLEHEEAKKSFDSQVSELCVMLEKYRSENQRIVLQKDREIETLQQHVSKEEKSKSCLEMELVECRGHVSQLEKDLASKEDELKELLKAIECMQTSKPSCAVPATPRRSALRDDVSSPSTLPAQNATTPPSPHPSTPQGVPVPCTPKPHPSSCQVPALTTPKRTLAASKLMATVLTTPQSSQSRVYNYRASSTPRVSKPRPMPCTPRSASKAKKFHNGDSGSEGEGEELKKFQELYPNMVEEECVFKKPTAKKTATGGSTTGVASIGKNMKTARRKPLTSRNGRGRAQEGEKKRSGGSNQVEDFSWFELDSVFGFGPDD